MAIVNITSPVDRSVIEHDPELLGGPHIPPAADDDQFLQEFFNRPDQGPEELTDAERAQAELLGQRFSAYMMREREWYLARQQAFKN